MEEWTVENFRSLIATDLPSIQRIAAMLDLLASEPERVYSTTAWLPSPGTCARAAGATG
ncbi:hypothetical protein GT034_35965 [Streptomyces sp. SID2563]|uniref:hypothetical protein n=1 Tax=Streptomyces sp. SID2563 TaxID=2690255 RepID=UPI00136872B9|nr:hypothetical protein [Streptomyces sp. SID2563]MYW13707.1 hypothetical protein [Streptomyces sp. SID2563]